METHAYCTLVASIVTELIILQKYCLSLVNIIENKHVELSPIESFHI